MISPPLHISDYFKKVEELCDSASWDNDTYYDPERVWAIEKKLKQIDEHLALIKAALVRHKTERGIK